MFRMPQIGTKRFGSKTASSQLRVITDAGLAVNDMRFSVNRRPTFFSRMDRKKGEA